METVLLYNIAGTPLASGLKPILLKMKIRVRVVTPDQYLQPIGLLAGLHGFEACADRNDRESFFRTDDGHERLLRKPSGSVSDGNAEKKTSTHPSESRRHLSEPALGLFDPLQRTEDRA